MGAGGAGLQFWKPAASSLLLSAWAAVEVGSAWHFCALQGAPSMGPERTLGKMLLV